MPRRDAENIFAEKQAVTAQAVGANGGIDCGAAGVDLANATKPFFLHYYVDVAFTDAGSDSALQIDLVDDDNGPLASVAVLEAAFMTIPALAAIGDKASKILPIGLQTQQFFGVRFTPTNGNLTTGTVTVWIDNQREVHTPMAAPYEIES